MKYAIRLCAHSIEHGYIMDDECIALLLERIYADIWKDAAPARVIDLAVFCDSGDTHTAGVSYFAHVRLERR